MSPAGAGTSHPGPASAHALVVGGTGMLRQATRTIGEAAGTVTAVARTPARLERLEAEVAAAGGRMVAIALDYRDTARLREALAERATQDRHFDLAVCWIHSTAPDAPALVAGHVDPGGGRYFHVLGSRALEPAVAERVANTVKAANPGLRYRQVVLSSVTDGGGRRWLTHEEISEGVLEAMRLDRDYVVGDG